MIYLDYSATTPVNKEVLDSFNKTCLEYIGNANSLHLLGVNSHNLEKKATEQIKKLLNLDEVDAIYTSGSSEANNLALKGIAKRYRGKTIITTQLEHSSILVPLKSLEKEGYNIIFVKTNNGLVDKEDLLLKVTDDTVLVSINAVNSETGVLQDIEGIAKILKDKKCFFHVDATQAIGKVKIDYNQVDLISFSSHKFYGLKGIGCLIKKKNVDLIPMIEGGKSTTIYRSGTPPLPLIVSVAKALRLALIDFEKKYDYVLELNNYLISKLKDIPNITINRNNSIPHILNISVLNIKPETMLHALENDNIYISTQSACSSGDKISDSVFLVTGSKESALHSIRISISYLTTKEEIDTLVVSLKKNIKALTFK